MMGGHLNAPSSKRFQTSTRPLPSQTRIFTRSARLARNTMIAPEKGYVARHISIHMCRVLICGGVFP